jgi:formiminotetrahydrofolate cyclodeaminase
MKLNEFIEELGSASPAPGGGSAAALVGAQGTALITMVANLTVGKPRYAEYEDLNQAALNEGSRLCSRLVSLVDRDAEAFNKLSAAYKLPKAAEDEKEARSKAIAQATLSATETPFEMMEISLKALYLCKSLLGKSNENASSDLGVSALCLLTCINGAWLNVLINLPGIENEISAEHFKTKGNKIINDAQSEADYIYNSIKNMIQ